jgi:hypothetical protein
VNKIFDADNVLARVQRANVALQERLTAVESDLLEKENLLDNMARRLSESDMVASKSTSQAVWLFLCFGTLTI